MNSVQAFLYLLMRDEMPAGAVEKLVRDVESVRGSGVEYSNADLAHYAQDLAERLR